MGLGLGGPGAPDDARPGALSLPGYQDDFALSVPPLAFVAFQVMFAIITTALITGVVADRMKFAAALALVAVLGRRRCRPGETMPPNARPLISFIIAKAIDAFVGLRVPPDDEGQGLDVTQHSETAYAYGDIGMGRLGG